MLILLLCGGTTEQVINDYLISADIVSGFKAYAQEGSKYKLDKHMATSRVLRVEKSYIEGALEYLKTNYGSVDGYLDACGVSASDIATVRGKLKSHSKTSDPAEEAITQKNARHDEDAISQQQLQQ